MNNDDQTQTDPFVPSLEVSQHRRNVTLMIGIPSVQRAKANYLSETLDSLLAGMDEAERRHVLIIVLLSDLDAFTVLLRSRELRTKFASEIASGLIDIVSPSASFYPEFVRLGSSEKLLQRQTKQTKQTVDFAYLMIHAMNRGKYFLQLEDGIVAAAHYVSGITQFTIDQELSNPRWVFLQFSTLGYIGKLFRNRDLMAVSLFCSMFHSAKPVDWLLFQYVLVKVCQSVGNGPLSNECEQSLNESIVTYSPSLFQHMDVHSSLNDKL